MKRLASSLLALVVLALSCAAGPAARRRPKVDVSAMREAMEASRSREQLASPAAYSHFLVSRLAYQDGDYRRAVDELRLALATDDGDSFLLTRLAEAHVRLGEPDRAEVELKKVLSHHPDYAPAQLLLGRVLLAAKRYSQARVHLRQAIQLEPGDPEGYLALADLLLAQSAPDEAIAVVEELSQALPGEPSGYKRLGLALLDHEDLPRAQKLLERAVEKDPGDFETWAMLAQLYEAAGKLDRAEATFDKALERDPDSRDVLLWAGKLSLRQGSVVRARAYFDRLLSLSEDQDWVLKVVAAYFSAGHLPEAAEVAEQARSVSPNPKLSFSTGLVRERLKRFVQAADAYAEVPADSDVFHLARLRRAMCLSMAGLHARALALFEEGRKERPDYLVLYPAYAEALERAGLVRDATALLEKAAKDHSTPELLDALANLYERQGRGAEALDLLVRAAAAHPRDEDLLFVLGTAWERRGELDRALQQMRALLEVNPRNAAALNFIGYTLADKGRELDEAERLISRALELQPDSGAFLDSLGWLQFRRGDFARAVTQLERAVERLPEDALVREHLGDAYRSAGRRKDALDAYRQALKDLLGEEHPGPAFPAQRQTLERKLKLLSSEAQDR